MRSLIFAILVAAASCVGRTRAADPVRFRGDVTDPAGDAVHDPRVPNPPDLLRATVLVTDASVEFRVRFVPGTFDSATTAVTIQLDVDRDTTTGIRLPYTMGVDYVVGLGKFSGTDIVLSRAANGASCEPVTALCTYTPIGRWPATFHFDGIDGAVPRSRLDRFDGRLNFRVIAYVKPDGAPFSITTDHMPNFPGLPATVR